MSESYSLRQVIELTGLSEFTLRGWENRYQALKPRRNATGRRRYSMGDLQKALRLRDLVERGHRIGQIADLSVAKLDALIADEVEPVQVAASPEVDEALRLLELQDWDDLERSLKEQARAAKALPVLREFVIPLLHGLALKVAAGEVSVAQEHIFSSLLRKRIYALSDAAAAKETRAKFVIAAPEGDLHELGILTAHALVSHHGFRSLYIGPHCPKDELCETAFRFGASYVLLGSTVSRSEGAKDELLTYINFLDRNLPRKVSLWLGGRNGGRIQLAIDRQAVVISSLHELDRELQAIAGR